MNLAPQTPPPGFRTDRQHPRGNEFWRRLTRLTGYSGGWSGFKPGYSSILRYFQPNPRGLGSHGKAPQSLQNTIWRTFGSRRHDQRVPMRPTHGNTNQKYSGNPDSVQRKSCFGLNSKCIQLDTNSDLAALPARQNLQTPHPRRPRLPQRVPSPPPCLRSPRGILRGLGNQKHPPQHRPLKSAHQLMLTKFTERKLRGLKRVRVSQPSKALANPSLLVQQSRKHL